MFKRSAKRAWYGNIGGLIVGAVIVPIFMKRPALTTDPALWIVLIGFVGALLCIPAIIYFKKRIVANHDFSDDGLGLLQPMQAWSTLAFLPFMAGIFHYVKTGQLWFYMVTVIVSCILISLFKPVRESA